MVKMIIRNNGSEHEAKDVYQDSLIIFWQKVRKGDFVLSSKISTFIFGICQRRWMKELERKGKLNSDLPEQHEIIDIHRNERIKIINECLNELGDKCRRILIYYYFDNMTMEDIAKKLGMNNADTAKSKKYKCKAELDKIIKSKYSIQDFLD